ncbi:hypothetical protein D9V34_09500 [Mycetocola lacteus]|uniref:WXG100 family type VII secretion target n=1 Tax=Mycetocola lacteus TaxID=76637 RepID=A0A3L7ANW8_9MICO|nr:hypothetical protein [Mycetocola lacteus]RLP82047.1 hypothetical protein D9V34_09500 [Mycetocola lacteus]
MSSITPVADPASVLTTPSVSKESLDKVMQARGNSIFGQFDNIARQLFNFSPLDEWVFNPFIGDWQRMDKAAAAWTNTATALEMFGQNAQHLTEVVGDDWEGEGFDAFKASQASFAEKLPPLAQQCTNAAELNLAFVDYASQVAGLILDILDILAQKLIRMSAEAAVPVAGWVAAGIEVADLVAKVCDWSVRILDLINSVVRIAQAYIAIMTGFQNSLSAITSLLDTWTSVASNVGAVASLASEVLNKAPKQPAATKPAPIG